MGRWISFDCYGTLIDWQHGMASALSIVAPGRASDLMAHHRDVEGRIERENPTMRYHEVLAQSLREMAERIGYDLYAGDEHILSATLPFWRPYDDTGPALAALKEAGWKIAILSNVDREAIKRTVAHFPVPVDLIITAEEVGSYKPAPGHFEEFLRRTDATSGQWVHAAVNLEYDLHPTSKMGAKTVWINRERETGDTSMLLRELPDMTGLPALLEEVR